ncbi:SEC-C metal-binding domain-containing protein [Chlamydiifrater phoenicopteri]|uniref:SEC-C metal-binding domain-containing protein n=1 Tax=Chlamydiifrater phoenicopteri TaxID=2681469 RepID=UPI001BD02E52|nr:SEC-C metal-binding domain-containing protein [Chlamydiifrater phoenicopteri]
MSKKPNRNDPCHCGSGKKYKQCCLKKETVIARHTPEGKFKFSAELATNNPSYANVFQRSAEQLKNSQNSKTTNKFSLTKEKLLTQGKKSIKRQKAKEERDISEKLHKHQFSVLNLSDQEEDKFIPTEEDYRVSPSDKPLPSLEDPLEENQKE